MTIKQLKRGTYFTLKPIEYPTEKQVYVREGYDRKEKKYMATNFADISAGRYLKGDTVVYTEFFL